MFLVLALAIVIDVWKHKIPNDLLMILLVINLISVHTLSVDLELTFEGMLWQICQMVLIFGILFPFFSIGAIGAGDVKLILISALVMEKPILFFFTIFAIAAVISVIKLFLINKKHRRFNYLTLYVKNLILTKAIGPYIDYGLKSEHKVEYSVHLSIPVFLAAVFCFALF